MGGPIFPFGRSFLFSTYRKQEVQRKDGRLMNLLDVVRNMPWAIQPEMLEVIHQIVWNHSEGIKADIADIEAKLGRKLENTYNVRVEDGVAIIPIHGVISKRMNFFMEISGGVSTELLSRDYNVALEDESVKAILLDTESPGGAVDGTFEAAETIFSGRGKKPVIAYANGLMASAAMWIGSAADEIIAGETAQVGSIGVIAIHTEYSKAQENKGIKSTVLSSGKYKAMGNNIEPLSEEARGVIQGRLDYYYGMFVNAVARNRNRSVEDVLKNMAEGRVFIGKQAVDAGLADNTGSFEFALEYARSKGREKGKSFSMKSKVKSQSSGGKIMNLDELKAQHPDLYQAIVQSVRTEVTAELTATFDKEKTQMESKFSTDLAGVNARIDDLSKENLSLRKTNEIRAENERRAKADSIWTEKLSESVIPIDMQEKCRPMVGYSSFVSDGNLDVAGFSAAVDAEIKDWESRLTQSVVLGGAGGPVKSAVGDRAAEAAEAEDDAEVDRMLKLAGE